jgi:hypothetical protein
MNNKLNIEELKYLIPDYITGKVSDDEKIAIEKALLESAELREFHNEMKEVFGFVEKVKFEEPSPQYWANMLPRIHERIDKQEAGSAASGFSWDKISAFWKVLVPVAAVILIAVIYFAVKPSETQMTKDDSPKKENINNDTNSDKQKINKQEDTNENKSRENIVKENPGQNIENFIKERKAPVKNEDNFVKDETPEKPEENQLPVKEEFTAIEVDELSVFAVGEGAGFDEELENELKELNNHEQNMLLKELENSNL